MLRPPVPLTELDENDPVCNNLAKTLLRRDRGRHGHPDHRQETTFVGRTLEEHRPGADDDTSRQRGRDTHAPQQLRPAPSGIRSADQQPLALAGEMMVSILRHLLPGGLCAETGI